MEQLLIVNSILVWLALLGQFLLTFALIRKVNGINQMSGNGGQPREFLKVGQAAPDFEVQTLEGELVTKASYMGRKVAFIFLSPGCSPCYEAVPTLEELHSGATESGVYLCIVMTSTQEQAKKFVDEQIVSLPVLVTTPDGKFKRDYKVGGTPFYCLLNEQGLVEATGFFDNSWQALVNQWRSDSRQDGVGTSVLMGKGG
ncbi:MAG: hypothetical protein DHS20C20_02220 [Ardenticatenaceae bacterium]|nr:MAG: hypothetical protein DHS20C20_02220 [Ardenticatenaceae bacterium]